jgi:hypothetical protein
MNVKLSTIQYAIVGLIILSIVLIIKDIMKGALE